MCSKKSWQFHDLQLVCLHHSYYSIVNLTGHYVAARPFSGQVDLRAVYATGWWLGPAADVATHFPYTAGRSPDRVQHGEPEELHIVLARRVHSRAWGGLELASLSVG